MSKKRDARVKLLFYYSKLIAFFCRSRCRRRRLCLSSLLAIFTMTTFDYNYQNSFRFCFVIEICQFRWGLKNNSPNLHKKTTNWRILVVVVKWRHRAIVLLLWSKNFATMVTWLPTSPLYSNWWSGKRPDLTRSFTRLFCSSLRLINVQWDFSGGF